MFSYPMMVTARDTMVVTVFTFTQDGTPYHSGSGKEEKVLEEGIERT